MVICRTMRNDELDIWDGRRKTENTTKILLFGEGAEGSMARIEIWLVSYTSF